MRHYPKFSLLFSTLFPLLILGQPKPSLTFNPTGAYKLNQKTVEKNGETYGYFGEIKIKSLNRSMVAVTLFVCKGAPSYSSGTIWDTLEVKGNVATYLPEGDSTCKITFTFKRKKIIVDQVQSDINMGCDFGHGVFADGTYIKTSDKIPLIEDPATG